MTTTVKPVIRGLLTGCFNLDFLHFNSEMNLLGEEPVK